MSETQKTSLCCWNPRAARTDIQQDVCPPSMKSFSRSIVEYHRAPRAQFVSNMKFRARNYAVHPNARQQASSGGRWQRTRTLRGGPRCLPPPARRPKKTHGVPRDAPSRRGLVPRATGTKRALTVTRTPPPASCRDAHISRPQTRANRAFRLPRCATCPEQECDLPFEPSGIDAR